MSETSRPIRAVGVVLVGWIILRASILIMPAPVIALRDIPEAKLADRVQAIAHDPVPAEPLAIISNVRFTYAATKKIGAFVSDPVSARRGAVLPPAPTVIESPIVPPFQGSARANTLPDLPVGTPAGVIKRASPSPERNRFQLSAWSLVREATSAGGLAPGGTLGGSQIGARGWFEPGPKGFVLTARISTPLASRSGSEASAGFGFKSGNFGVIVEERVSLDAGGGTRPSATAFGGVSDVRLRGKLRLDAYAQAGVVGLRNRIGFADGAVRIEHPVIGKSVRVSIGAGAWGGAQPGLTRLDIGPQLVARLPVMGGNLRIAGEWRFRIAGNANPGSGPTLSIGADF